MDRAGGSLPAMAPSARSPRRLRVAHSPTNRRRPVNPCSRSRRQSSAPLRQLSAQAASSGASQRASLLAGLRNAARLRPPDRARGRGFSPAGRSQRSRTERRGSPPLTPPQIYSPPLRSGLMIHFETSNYQRRRLVDSFMLFQRLAGSRVRHDTERRSSLDREKDDRAGPRHLIIGLAWAAALSIPLWVGFAFVFLF